MVHLAFAGLSLGLAAGCGGNVAGTDASSLDAADATATDATRDTALDTTRSDAPAASDAVDSPDVRVPADSGNRPDVQTPADTGVTPDVATDTGTAPDVATDTGTAPDVVTDTGTTPDVVTDTGAAPDVGTFTYLAGNPCMSGAGVIYYATGESGSQDCTIPFAGGTRSYRLHIPANYRAGTSALVIHLHGDGGTGQSVEQESTWTEKSDAVGFAVAYPNGSSPPGRTDYSWDFYFKDQSSWPGGPDDSAFVRAVINSLESRIAPDPRKIYASGMSAGAFMTHRLGVELADVLAAIAPAEGPLYGRPVGTTLYPPTPVRPVSVLIFQGDADAVVLYCGRSGPNAEVASMDVTMNFWLASDGCTGTNPSTTLCTAGMPSAVTERSGTGCAAGTDVQFYRLERGTHSWYTTPMNNPTGTPYNPAFNATTGVTTVDIAWNFFAAHAR